MHTQTHAFIAFIIAHTEKKCDERQITVMTKTINLNFTAN